MGEIADLPFDERAALCDWIGERAETVLAVGALLSGHGRVWFLGDPLAPAAVLVESGLVPGEPQGFGNGDALLDLLAHADSWGCVEAEAPLAQQLSNEFDRRWGLAKTVIDVVHELKTQAKVSAHPLVRRLSALDARHLEAASPGVLPDRELLVAAAEIGRVFAAVNGNVIVGHGSSLAASRAFADVGVHVAEAFREQGIATATASLACQAVQQAGLTPVWGAGSENAASLRVANKIGFVEVARLAFLVREQ